MYINKYQSPLGEIVMASDGKSLRGLWIYGQKYFGDILPDKCEEKDLHVFNITKTWLDIYFSGEAPDFTPPVFLEGSRFRLGVWEILMDIPYGRVMTYGEIANIMAGKMGVDKMSPQAVGGAVGHNPISIIVPCHRVVGSNGSLTGYAGGIDKKVKLLELEKVNMEKLFIPKKGMAL